MSSLLRGSALLLGCVLFAGGTSVIYAACTPPVIDNVPIAKKDLSAEEDLGVPPDLTGADLTGADFAGEDLAGVDLAGADLAPRVWVDLTPSGITTNFYTAWSNGSNLAYVVGAGPLMYKSVAGGAFVPDTSTRPANPAVPMGTFNLLGIGGIAPGPPTTPLYLTGRVGAIWAYSGDLAAGSGTWTAETSGATGTVWNTWVAPDGVAFAVGTGYAAKRSGSSTWTAMSGIGADTAYNVSGTKAGGYSIYAVGAGGKIWYSTGTDWQPQTSGVTTDLYGVYAFSATDIYAVGAGGTILHSTGVGTWTGQTPPVAATFQAVHGASPSEVYVVGGADIVLKKTGAASVTWVKETIPAGPSGLRVLNGVWAGPNAVYVVGQAGAILRK